MTGLATPYSITQHADKDIAPPASWTLDTTTQGYNASSQWHRTIVNAFDVSSLTQQGSVTLTLQLTISVPVPSPGYLDFSPLSVDLGLYGATSLKFTQTPAAFRPRDARDAAAQCGTNDGDCHTQFTATLAGLENAYISPSGTIGVPDIVPLNPIVNFTLAPATLPASAGASGPWLQGTSTNFGADSATDPDYLFEAGIQPAASQLSVQSPTTMQTAALPVGSNVLYQTPSPVPAPSVTFKVTSRDFGGKAYLRASLVLAPGVPLIDAEIVDSNGNDVTPPTDNARTQGTCGTDFATHPFASLPVDQDCNGIADSWEDVNSPQRDPQGNILRDPAGKILHLPQDWDQETGYTATSPKGDGWSVHDEYRGFHFVLDDGVTDRWVSTDPVNKFDLFFWDPGVPVVDPPWAGPLINTLTTALRTILCLQGNSDEMGYGASFPPVGAFPAPANIPPVPSGTIAGYAYCNGGINEYNPTLGPGSPANPLRFLYRRVNAAQAQARNPFNPQEGVNWFNINSLTSSPTQGNHTVILYRTVAGLGSGDGQTVLGFTWNQAVGRDAKHTMIDIAVSVVARTAVENRPIHPTTLTAQVLAHETGHWFGQFHPTRPVTYIDATPTTLQWGNYTFPDNNMLTSILVHVGLQFLPVYRGGTILSEALLCDSANAKLPNTYIINRAVPPVTVGKVACPFPVSRSGLFVNAIQNELMDWTADKLLLFPSQWHFDPRNLDSLCAKNPCN